MLLPRLYRDQRDLEAICQILIVGRQAANGTYYVHLGDIHWWLYYRLPGKELWPYLYLWEDGQDRVWGWSLLSPDEQALDVFVQPDLVGSPKMERAFEWTVNQSEALARADRKDTLYKLWNFSGDQTSAGLLRRLGFAPEDEDAYLVQDLNQALPEPVLPPGFVARPCQGEVQVEPRARAQYGAFGSQIDFEVYTGRFRRFMHSPAYDPQRDWVVEAPDGRIASFCIFWLDPVNQVGLFEPVGTHPDFQRRGLGRAVMLAALRAMQQMGMETAIVCTPCTNLPAVRLYESSGFEMRDRLVTFCKPLV